jgi:AcrR family transcriptional regulator
MTAEAAGSVESTVLEQRAVERSLRAARERAQERLERIILAAYDLIGETGGTDFTLQDVAARAGVSLRTFYQYFDGRDDLLLAVFAHGVETTVPMIAAAVARHRSPVRRLQAFVETSFHLVFDDERPQSRPLTYYHLRLTQTDPEALGRILAPRNEILLGILKDGVASSAFRKDIPLEQLAAMLAQTLLAMMHTNVLGTAPVGTQMEMSHIWRFCLAAVSPPARRPRG